MSAGEGTGLACWAPVPIEKLVWESDLIVVGRLRDAGEVPHEHPVSTATEGKRWFGTIVIQDVLFGAKLHATLRLQGAWRPTEDAAHQDAIYLLKRLPDGSVTVTHPMSPAPIEELREVREAIRLLRTAKKDRLGLVVISKRRQKVSIDGEPVTGSRLLLKPGTHEIRSRASGVSVDDVRTFEVRAGTVTLI